MITISALIKYFTKILACKKPSVELQFMNPHYGLQGQHHFRANQRHNFVKSYHQRVLFPKINITTTHAMQLKVDRSSFHILMH